MAIWTEADLADVARALERFDQPAVRELCGRFTVAARSDGVSVAHAEAILRRLQRRRYVDLVSEVAEAALLAHPDSVAVRHRYALALLDAGRIAAAEGVLAALPAAIADDDGEVRGALARIHKERFLANGDGFALSQAIDGYYRGYVDEAGDRHYHGINAAALLTRAADDEVAVPRWSDPRTHARQLAEEILKSIDTIPQPSMWDHATAAEACLALDRPDEAFDRICRYAASAADAFEFNSTLRQFERVWRLDRSTGAGTAIVSLLRAKLLLAVGGSLTLPAAESGIESVEQVRGIVRALGTDEDGPQRVFATAAMRPLYWFSEAQRIGRSVARIEERAHDRSGPIVGEGFGTGFVLAGSAFESANGGMGKWPARVLVTAHHVIYREFGSADPAADSQVDFRGLGDGRTHIVPAVELWQSEALDACILALPDRLADDIVPLSIGPDPVDIHRRQDPRAYVIGHPRGSDVLKLSFENAALAGVRERHVVYKTSTEKGNSGSPVLDEHWQVFAMHHFGDAGGNIGVRIDAIVRAAARDIR